MNKDLKKIIVTGSAEFIGSALCSKLLERGDNVVGLDNHNDYYDPKIKADRLSQLEEYTNYLHYRVNIADQNSLEEIFNDNQPHKVVNLAAQAGVRYSLENPLAYINSNILGFANILENCRHHNVEHLVYASTSSVYGANTKMPFSENESANHPLSVYAASKKSNELMAHAYSHLYQLPTTGLRFFTVYGPWGRPDMSYFKFLILNKKKKYIEIYNFGKHQRSFTYIDDLVSNMFKILSFYKKTKKRGNSSVFNLGNEKTINLMDFLKILEKVTNIKFKKNL